MLRQLNDLKEWLPIVRAEYIEFPGMHLTKPQIQRLWDLDPQTCDAVVAALEAEKFLRRTERDAYVRAY
jgi:putative heme degradation protein